MRALRLFGVTAVLVAASLCGEVQAQASRDLAASDNAPAISSEVQASVRALAPSPSTVYGTVGTNFAHDLTNVTACQSVAATTRAAADWTNTVEITASNSGTAEVHYVTYLNLASAPSSYRRTGVFHACEYELLDSGTPTPCPNDGYNLLYAASRGSGTAQTAAWADKNVPANTLTYYWWGVSQSVAGQTILTGLVPGNKYTIRLGLYRQLVSSGTTNYASATACVSSALVRY